MAKRHQREPRGAAPSLCRTVTSHRCAKPPVRLDAHRGEGPYTAAFWVAPAETAGPKRRHSKWSRHRSRSPTPRGPRFDVTKHAKVRFADMSAYYTLITKKLAEAEAEFTARSTAAQQRQD